MLLKFLWISSADRAFILRGFSLRLLSDVKMSKCSFSAHSCGKLPLRKFRKSSSVSPRGHFSFSRGHFFKTDREKRIHLIIFTQFHRFIFTARLSLRIESGQKQQGEVNNNNNNLDYIDKYLLIDFCLSISKHNKRFYGQINTHRLNRNIAE